MLAYLLLIWTSFAFESPIQEASKLIQSGNYLMAEATLLDADPSQQPVGLAELFFELAVRMRSVATKQLFISETLAQTQGWQTVSQLALAGLALHQKDWQRFEKHAHDFFFQNDPGLKDHPIRLRLLYHLARHTPLSLPPLLLSPSETAWLQSCRNSTPSQTWPTEAPSDLPFYFQYGHLLETRYDFDMPLSKSAPSLEDQYVSLLLHGRRYLNQNNLDGAATKINQLMAINRNAIATHLKIPFYQIMLEYFQRKDQLDQAAKTAGNLAIVRNRAFLPIQNWPERVKQIQRLVNLPEPSPIAKPATAAVVTLPSSSKPKPKPMDALDKPSADEAPAIEPTPMSVDSTANIALPATATKDNQPSGTGSESENLSPEPRINETSSAPKSPPPIENKPPTDIATEATSATKENEPVPNLGDAPPDQKPHRQPILDSSSNAEDNSVNTPVITIGESDGKPHIETNPEVTLDQPRTTIEPGREYPPETSPIEPASADPNLALARALMADGDMLMAEAQFMAVQPRRSDVLRLGADLATIALRTNSLATKTAFYRQYLNRQDAWRGVGLTVLSIFSAKQQDWPSFEKYATALLAAYAPFQDPVKFRLIYYLARYTQALPTEFRLIEALWFQKSRDLTPFSIWPNSQQSALPYTYRNAYLLENQQGFTLPEQSAQDDEVNRFFWGLLQVRTALNVADLNLAAKEINTLARLAPKNLDDQWRYLFHELSREYFEKRGEVDKALVARRNGELHQSWTLLPIQAFPSRASKVTELLADNRVAPLVPLPPETTIDAIPADRPQPKMTSPLTQDMDWDALDSAMEKGVRNLELPIRAKEPQTTYERIHKAYLLGQIYLSKGRYQSAYERLTLAENLVGDLPFPNLESKVMLAMADYYDAERNPQQANWYRIAAVQLWNQPANLPILANKNPVQRRSPFPELVDQSLKSATRPGSIHTLIYYSELASLLALREKAYHRDLLSDNLVLSQQLQRIGQELVAMVGALATQPNPQVTPRRFNDTQKLWTGLWHQVYPYFQGEKVPGLTGIQSRLTSGERLLVFTEGERFFGVLVISQDQGFAVGLGSKSTFFNLPPQAQFDFLEGRLGPLWTNAGGLTIKLSKSFRSQTLIDQLRARMTDPHRLRLVSSLKALAQSNTQSSCEGLLLVHPQIQADLIEWTDALAMDQTRLLMGAEATRSQLLEHLGKSAHLVLAGEFTLTDQGLIYQAGSLDFKLHELPRFHGQLCSLTLIAPAGPTLLAMLDELAFVQIRSAPAIRILHQLPTKAMGLPDTHLAELFETAKPTNSHQQP